MELNKWSEAEVNRAESTWGQRVPEYTADMFNFLIDGCKSWLDLGCGFGRFLKYLEERVEDPEYIGYDSSSDMIDRIKENFPHYSPRLFVHDIVDPINVTVDAVLCCAVLIHLPAKSQNKILNNIKAMGPAKIAFDINSPAEQTIAKQPYFERQIKGSENKFRMTWQSHYDMTKKVLHLFNNYKLTMKYYDLRQGRYKVIYLLKR